MSEAHLALMTKLEELDAYTHTVLHQFPKLERHLLCAEMRAATNKLLRLEEDLSAAHLRLSRTYIESLDWSACIQKYDRAHSLIYCDPPYWGTEGYGVDFGLHQYQRMAELARTVKGRMIVSVNDIPEMRQAFAGLTIERVDINYTVGGGGRSKAKAGELIIRNW